MIPIYHVMKMMTMTTMMMNMMMNSLRRDRPLGFYDGPAQLCLAINGVCRWHRVECRRFDARLETTLACRRSCLVEGVLIYRFKRLRNQLGDPIAQTLRRIGKVCSGRGGAAIQFRALRDQKVEIVARQVVVKSFGDGVNKDENQVGDWPSVGSELVLDVVKLSGKRPSSCKVRQRSYSV